MDARVMLAPSKTQKKDEPPRMEDVEQPQRVQKTDDLRSVNLLDLPFLRHRPLQDKRAQNRCRPQ